MKAAIIEKYGSITVQEMPEPIVGEYDALCEILYGATCTGTDSHIIAGSFPWLSPLPTVLGHESIGRVVELGSKVRNLRVGDLIVRVGTPPSPDGKISVNWGGFAELGIAKDHWAMAADGLPEKQWKPARQNQIIPIGVDERVAPMFITWCETLSFIIRMGVKAGARLLVVGSGGNGLSYSAHGKNLGAACVAMVGSAKLEAAAKAKGGVDIYVDYKRDDLAKALNEANPEGFDFIIDAVGQVGVADKVLPCLKPGGTYGTYGIDDIGKISINPSKARGSFKVHAISYEEYETHQQVSDFVLQGKLDATLWYDLDEQFPLADIAAAFAHVKQRKSPKALVRMKK